MPSILVVGSRQCFAMRPFKPSLSPLQGLNGWFFVHAYHQGILRRIQVKPNNISRLTCKFRIRRNTPTAPSLKANPTLAQHRPYFIIRYFPSLSPRSLPFHWAYPFGGGSSICAESCARSLRCICVAARARFIKQTFQALLDETASPFADPCDTCPQPLGNLSVCLPFSTPENDLRSLRHGRGSLRMKTRE